MKKLLFLFPLAALLACRSTPITPAVSPWSIVPLSLHIEQDEGQPSAILKGPVRFMNVETTDFAWTEAWPQAADGFPIVFRKGFSSEQFYGDQGAEGAYSLDVFRDSIVVCAESDAGRYNALATLMQLVPVGHWPARKGEVIKLGFKIAPVHIKDQPRYAYRGMHLDVCRHFMPVEFIEKYIDNLALHKFNRFHWHLTEDQGWRIEIKKYPKLTEVGAWRSASQTGAYSEQRFDSLRHGGFYTQEEARHIVAYAAKRGITVIPEIEMPGHSLAALAAYPDLSCTGETFHVAHGWGVFEDVYCAGNPEVYSFLEGVLDEIMEIFPSPLIHIGGDECPKTRWETCAKCQTEMARYSLKNEHELQSHFITRMERYLNSHGRNIIGWDEILEGGLAPNAAVMSWRGVSGGTQAASMEHQVVMTPGKPLYFDHYQFNPDEEPLAIGGFNSLADVYGFNPVEAVPEEYQVYILGAQANVWTEYMETADHVEHMVQPRASALSEVLWLGEKRPGEDAAFRRAMEYHVKRLKAMGWNYAPYEFKKVQENEAE